MDNRIIATTRRWATLLLMAGMSMAGSAQANVLFSQPLTTNGGFFSDPGQIMADDFSIAGGGAISEVIWYGDAYYDLPFGPMSVTFYADTGSGPGALLATGSATPTSVDTGLVDTYGKHIFEFTAVIPTFNAAAGLGYFLSVGQTTSGHNFTWAMSNLLSGEFYSGDGGTVWEPQANTSAAYTLSSKTQVPEPATLALVALGLAGLGFSRRKQ